jgi:hypothetical protein
MVELVARLELKTKIFSVTNINNGGEIGVVKWYGAWRQYCFFPAPDTIYSTGCLDNIAVFMSELMQERKG